MSCKEKRVTTSKVLTNFHLWSLDCAGKFMHLPCLPRIFSAAYLIVSQPQVEVSWVS